MKQAKKWELIKEFIINNEPRRKDLNRFICINITKRYTEETYTDQKGVGHYGDGLQTFRRNGHVKIEGGRYKITKEGKSTNCSFYQLIPEIQIKRLKKRNEELLKELKESRKILHSIRINARRLHHTLEEFYLKDLY